MKQLLLYFFVLSTSLSFSQEKLEEKSQINSSLLTQNWQLIPTIEDNLPSAIVLGDYNVVISFKIPSFVNKLNSITLTNSELMIVELEDISGLPNGLNFVTASSITDDVSCNNTSCTWKENEFGFIRLKGTPNLTGDFPLVITFKATFKKDKSWEYITQEVIGYELNVSSETKLKSNETKIELKQNSPNPFSSYTNITYSVTQESQVNFYVMNLLGEVVYRNSYNAKKGENTIKFDANKINKGIYLYSIEVEGKTMTKRMVIEK